MTSRFELLGLLGTVLIASGCSSLGNCPADGQPIVIDSGRTDTGALRYESAPPNALDPFPAKTQLWFEHGLGVTPFQYKAYLSFTRGGTNDDEGGSIAESAGNQVLYDCIDSRVVVLRNDTCEKSFYIRLIAEGASLTDKGTVCGDNP